MRYLDDFPVIPIDNIWDDTAIGRIRDDKIYVVQTSYESYRTLHSDDHRSRRPRARSDLRLRHHRLLSPSNGAAAGSRLTPRAWRWRWPAPASWARAIRFTCWPIPAKASSRKPKSPAPRRVRSRCTATSATASSMSACRTSRSSPSPTTRRSMSSGTSGRRSWNRCASQLNAALKKTVAGMGNSARSRCQDGRTQRRNCMPTGGRRASPGRRRSTPPSPPRPSLNTSTTSPTKTRRRSAWPGRSPSRASARTACWAWMRTTN